MGIQYFEAVWSNSTYSCKIPILILTILNGVLDNHISRIQYIDHGNYKNSNKWTPNWCHTNTRTKHTARAGLLLTDLSGLWPAVIFKLNAV